MTEKLNPEDIDKMSLVAQEAQPGVDLGSGIEALVDDLSPGKLAKPAVDKAVRAAAVASVLTGIAFGYTSEDLRASVPAEGEIMVTNKSNSQLLNFVTCFVETGNPKARLIVIAKVISYKASPRS